jgi:hypothetical protein
LRNNNKNIFFKLKTEKREILRLLYLSAVGQLKFSILLSVLAQISSTGKFLKFTVDIKTDVSGRFQSCFLWPGTSPIKLNVVW